MTTIVVIERSFAEPVSVDALAARQHAAPIEAPIRWLRTYAPGDCTRVVCLYEAPDAEAARLHQERTGLPYDRVWSGRQLLPPQAPEVVRGHSTVIVEREIARDFTEQAWLARAETGLWCLAAYRVSLVESIFAPGYGCALCVFVAPDAQGVRMANASMGAEHSTGAGPPRVWPCNGWYASPRGVEQVRPLP